MRDNAPYSGNRRKANEQVADSSVGPAYKALNAAKFPVNAVQKMKTENREMEMPTKTPTPAKASQEAYTPRPKWEDEVLNEPPRRNPLNRKYRGQTDY